MRTCIEFAVRENAFAGQSMPCASRLRLRLDYFGTTHRLVEARVVLAHPIAIPSADRGPVVRIELT